MVEQVARGEAFIVTKTRGPRMKVIPLDAPDEPAQQRIGFLAGQIRVPDDFDSMGSGDIAEPFLGTHASTVP